MKDFVSITLREGIVFSDVYMKRKHGKHLKVLNAYDFVTSEDIERYSQHEIFYVSENREDDINLYKDIIFNLNKATSEKERREYGVQLLRWHYESIFENPLSNSDFFRLTYSIFFDEKMIDQLDYIKQSGDLVKRSIAQASYSILLMVSHGHYDTKLIKDVFNLFFLLDLPSLDTILSIDHLEKLEQRNSINFDTGINVSKKIIEENFSYKSLSKFIDTRFEKTDGSGEIGISVNEMSDLDIIVYSLREIIPYKNIDQIDTNDINNLILNNEVIDLESKSKEASVA